MKSISENKIAIIKSLFSWYILIIEQERENIFILLSPASRSAKLSSNSREKKF